MVRRRAEVGFAMKSVLVTLVDAPLPTVLAAREAKQSGSRSGLVASISLPENAQVLAHDAPASCDIAKSRRFPGWSLADRPCSARAVRTTDPFGSSATELSVHPKASFAPARQWTPRSSEISTYERGSPLQSQQSARRGANSLPERSAMPFPTPLPCVDGSSRGTSGDQVVPLSDERLAYVTHGPQRFLPRPQGTLKGTLLSNSTTPPGSPLGTACCAIIALEVLRIIAVAGSQRRPASNDLRRYTAAGALSRFEPMRP